MSYCVNQTVTSDAYRTTSLSGGAEVPAAAEFGPDAVDIEVGTLRVVTAVSDGRKVTRIYLDGEPVRARHLNLTVGLDSVVVARLEFYP